MPRSNIKPDPLDRDFSQYQRLKSEGKLDAALKKLRTIQSNYLPNNQFIVSLQVDILMEMGNNQGALALAMDASSLGEPYSKLYLQKAQLISLLWKDIEQLKEGLESINKAIELYKQESVAEDLEPQLGSSESLKYWLDNKIQISSEMKGLQVDLKGLINANVLYDQIADIQKEVIREKVKTIELMSIFTAILALIFANVQAIKDFSEWKIMAYNVSLVAVLTWMLHLSRCISRGDPILPRFIKAESIAAFIGKLTGFILLLCFLVSAFAGTVFLTINVLVWARGLLWGN